MLHLVIERRAEQSFRCKGFGSVAAEWVIEEGMPVHEEEVVCRRGGFGTLSVRGFEGGIAWSRSAHEGGSEAKDEESIDCIRRWQGEWREGKRTLVQA